MSEKYNQPRFLLASIILIMANIIFSYLFVEWRTAEQFREVENILPIPIIFERYHTPQLIKTTKISEKEIDNVLLINQSLPKQASGKFKAWMPHSRKNKDDKYTSIFNKNSLQYNMQEYAVTDELGFRKYNGMYMVALGTYYAKTCGEKFNITLSSGIEFIAITGDIKNNKHTDDTNRYMTANGNIVEFIIDSCVMDKNILKLGDVSKLGLEGEIVKIEKIVG